MCAPTHSQITTIRQPHLIHYLPDISTLSHLRITAILQPQPVHYLPYIYLSTLSDLQIIAIYSLSIAILQPHLVHYLPYTYLTLSHLQSLPSRAYSYPPTSSRSSVHCHVRNVDISTISSAFGQEQNAFIPMPQGESLHSYTHLSPPASTRQPVPSMMNGTAGYPVAQKQPQQHHHHTMGLPGPRRPPLPSHPNPTPVPDAAQYPTPVHPPAGTTEPLTPNKSGINNFFPIFCSGARDGNEPESHDTTARGGYGTVFKIPAHMKEFGAPDSRWAVHGYTIERAYSQRMVDYLAVLEAVGWATKQARVFFEDDRKDLSHKKRVKKDRGEGLYQLAQIHTNSQEVLDMAVADTGVVDGKPAPRKSRKRKQPSPTSAEGFMENHLKHMRETLRNAVVELYDDHNCRVEFVLAAGPAVCWASRTAGQQARSYGSCQKHSFVLNCQKPLDATARDLMRVAGQQSQKNVLPDNLQMLLTNQAHVGQMGVQVHQRIPSAVPATGQMGVQTQQMQWPLPAAQLPATYMFRSQVGQQQSQMVPFHGQVSPPQTTGPMVPHQWTMAPAGAVWQQQPQMVPFQGQMAPPQAGFMVSYQPVIPASRSSEAEEQRQRARDASRRHQQDKETAASVPTSTASEAEQEEQRLRQTIFDPYYQQNVTAARDILQNPRSAITVEMAQPIVDKYNQQHKAWLKAAVAVKLNKTLQVLADSVREKIWDIQTPVLKVPKSSFSTMRWDDLISSLGFGDGVTNLEKAVIIQAAIVTERLWGAQTQVEHRNQAPRTEAGAAQMPAQAQAQAPPTDAQVWFETPEDQVVLGAELQAQVEAHMRAQAKGQIIFAQELDTSGVDLLAFPVVGAQPDAQDPAEPLEMPTQPQEARFEAQPGTPQDLAEAELQMPTQPQAQIGAQVPPAAELQMSTQPQAQVEAQIGSTEDPAEPLHMPTQPQEAQAEAQPGAQDLAELELQMPT
ncbi:hypothetical protein B0H66DRAFT_587561 [Apodospora peruviana]|uniref:Uncharacterized protein n=1 Tax=Apodospora peruviana TaxID=516989 RepID=A0AAE0IU78_9PEZI|nr:hypothetical protein B0H66DRAFT_587561 [Apodospora peruviana]